MAFFCAGVLFTCTAPVRGEYHTVLTIGSVCLLYWLAL